MKKILILGATGAMGQYLVPILAENDNIIDAVALDKGNFVHPRVNYIAGDAKNKEFLKSLLDGNYDAIVDFMTYNTSEIALYLPWLVNSCGQYIFLSSYRVYDNKELPIKENSPRLLETSDDPLIRLSDDYSIYKARGEDVVKLQPHKKWTIVRPAITYSFMRNQLVSFETVNTVGRAMQDKTVVLPEEAKNIQATMSWAGDVAQMIAGLLFNEKALGETFTVATAEHHPWEEVAEYYKDICNMKILWIPYSEFIKLVAPNPHIQLGTLWKLNYDRLFDRIIDNSKVLAATGMEQNKLMPLYNGLKYEVSRIPADTIWDSNPLIDKFLAARGMK